MNNLADLIVAAPIYSDQESISLAEQARKRRRQFDAGIAVPRNYNEIMNEYEYRQRSHRERENHHLQRVLDTLFDKIESLENEIENLKERLDTIDFYRE